MSKLTSWCAAYLKTRRIFCVLLPKIFTCTCSLIVRHLKKKTLSFNFPSVSTMLLCSIFVFFWNFLLFHWIWLLLLARARCDGMCSVNHWIFFSNHHYYSPSFVFNAWIYKTYTHGVLLLYRYHWFWKKKKELAEMNEMAGNSSARRSQFPLQCLCTNGISETKNQQNKLIVSANEWKPDCISQKSHLISMHCVCVLGFSFVCVCV